MRVTASASPAAPPDRAGVDAVPMRSPARRPLMIEAGGNQRFGALHIHDLVSARIVR